MFALITGLLAGTAHVWAGPDHLSAVAPVAAGRPGNAWSTGIRWGAGHAGGVAIVGVLALLFREALPLEAISSWSERLVGVLLVGIGIWAIRKAMKLTIHVHEHEHDGSRHVHIHAHAPGHTHGAEKAHVHSHVPVGIGILHGLAGSSHFLGVLPMLALPTLLDATLYLTAFTAGTIASMGLFALLVGYASKRCAHHGERFYRRFMSLSGVAALVVGCGWILLSVTGS